MKTVVYIDGQNFLYKAADVLITTGKIKEKQDLHTISLRKLVEELLGETDIEIRYYGTKLRKYKNTPEIEKKSTKMIDSQRQLKNSLSKQKIMFVESGKLKLRDSDKCKKCGAQDLRFQEKGVDVRMAIDLVVDSYESDVTNMVLLSSDTDLLPAVTMVTKSSKRLIYVGFSDKLTNALSIAATETQIIRDAEILSAFEDANSSRLKLKAK
ncbi:MAG TPA: NYN domain-containing protein [Candidatus Saccharimonadales bacterium]|jgi:uncharacterized LabA/DUF88 family protein